jgi:hypothetical protein
MRFLCDHQKTNNKTHKIDRLFLRLSFRMNLLYKFLFVFCVLLFSNLTGGFTQSVLVSKLKLTDAVPPELLASRTVVLFDVSYSKPELEQIQKIFAQTGIDAEAYIEEDVALAGKDVTHAYANYFLTRDIRYILFLDKPAGRYRMTVAPFNKTSAIINESESAWSVSDSDLNEMLMTAYRNSWISQKKQNLLVNEIPEMNVTVNPFSGNRSEFFAIDLKVDMLAVPFFNNANADSTLVRVMKENYPFKFKLIQSVADEQELKKKGFIFVLCMIKTRGIAAKQLLGYDKGKSESAYVSTTYPNGQAQLKAIPAETPVYKFYVKHINSGNIFLGTKWDADTTWEQALKNHIKGLKAELRIE